MGPDALLARLRALTALDDTDTKALAGLFREREVIAGERMLVQEGDRPSRLHLVVDGLAARVKQLRDGGRYLSALLPPGDVCDVDGLHVARYDYGVVALTRTTLLAAPRVELLALCDRSPPIAHVLAWLGFVDNALLNEAATSLARRSARARVAHLFCELACRLAAVGQGGPTHFALPLSQMQLGDVLGLTSVHVNRTLRDLRVEGLATFSHGRVAILDEAGLRRAADFAPDYLHLEGMRGVRAAT